MNRECPEVDFVSNIICLKKMGLLMLTYIHAIHCDFFEDIWAKLNSISPEKLLPVLVFIVD